MKNYQKVTFILSCISLLISIMFIIQTYAKYTTAVSGDTNMSIARWNIIVNGVDVKTNATLTGAIVPEFAR